MNVRNLAGFALGPIGVAAVSLITVPVTAWYFRADDIGKISMLQISVSFCLLLFSLGLDQSYVREYHETKNKEALFKSCVMPGLVLLLFSLTLFLVFDPTFLSKYLFEIKEPTYSYMIAICLVAAFIGRFFSLILRMQERGWAFSISQIAPKVVFLIMLGLFVFQKNILKLNQLLLAHTLAYISVVAIFGLNTSRQWRTSTQSISIRKQQELIKFGLPLVVSSAAFWGMTSLDRVFLKHYSGFGELGLYSVINSFAGVAVVLQNIFTTIWAPTAYKWHAEGVGSDEFQKVVDRVLVVVVLVFSVAGMFSWVLTYLLPENYQAGQYIIMPCLIYPLLYSLSETTGIGLGIARKSGWSMLAALLSLGVNVLSNYWLVPIYGAAGAASATGLSFLALLILRTEFSNLFYMNLRRGKLYFYIFACVFLSIATAIFKEKYSVLFAIFWLFIFAIAIKNTNILKLLHDRFFSKSNQKSGQING
ncbi:lipopolysaccharide biosynthesis protein [Chromobacterium violaceum]|uniref:lipopolysaccharide biosynthesis protein n=1 Tax=Chromobacterium violaceum TaxID=536 RepID=UPI0035A5A5C4